MILSIVGYGHPALREKTQEVKPDHEGLEQLIENMYQTMYKAHGVGLAAPQIGLSLRLFVIDASPMEGEDDAETAALKEFKQVFINPQKIEEDGNHWPFEEGCLSIPDIREKVMRPHQIRLRYQDEQFNEHEAMFTGTMARVIQHEYDHLEGVLFTDLISPMRKRILKSRLGKIAKGQVAVDYPMKFSNRVS